MELRGANVLLTGASGGIGGHIARALAREGAQLALAGRDEAALRRLAGELGTRAEPVAGDLAEPGGPAALAGAAQQALGPIDVVVNNAGMELASAFERTTGEEIERLARLNFVAPVELTRHLVEGMLERGRGHAVFVGSLSGHGGTAYQAVYAGTKAALLAVVQSLRQEYADRPVGFSLVAPGPVADDGMYARMRDDGASMPFGMRMARPERVAKAVVRAVRRDAPVLLVAGGPIRPALALAALAPRAYERIALRIGVGDMFAGPARRRDRP